MLWLVLTALLFVFIYLKVIKPLNYWKDKGIACENSWPILGNVALAVFRIKSTFEIVKDSYRAFPDQRYYGCHQFMIPMLVIRDVQLIKQITVKDFDHFTDHYPIVSEEADPLMGKNLGALNGQRWRDMRTTLSPSFTGSKIRAMFVLLTECAKQFTRHYAKKSSQGVTTLEMRDTFTRFTNDAIASTAFGLKVDSFEDRNNEFYLMGKEATSFRAWWAFKYMLLYALTPKVARYFNLSFLPKHVADFFRRIVKETMEQRAAGGLMVRPDMIHLLMEAKKGQLKHEDVKETIDTGFATVEEFHVGKAKKFQKRQLTDTDITAQALIFFLAGFETTSTLMSFMAYELAVNPDVQEKLQEEVDETLGNCNGKITYEALMGMKYLDKVVSETLRKWPPLVQRDRVCVKDYAIQPERPNEKLLSLKKGDIVAIPVIGIHHDPSLWPNPDKFEPERFSDGNKLKIEQAAYMPFGAGPRNCIGSRLALLESKTLMFHLLSEFEIGVVAKTQILLRVGFKPFTLVPEEGIWLGLKKRNASKH